jgi:hypothetical protein
VARFHAVKPQYETPRLTRRLCRPRLGPLRLRFVAQRSWNLGIVRLHDHGPPPRPLAVLAAVRAIIRGAPATPGVAERPVAGVGRMVEQGEGGGAEGAEQHGRAGYQRSARVGSPFGSPVLVFPSSSPRLSLLTPWNCWRPRQDLNLRPLA